MLSFDFLFPVVVSLGLLGHNVEGKTNYFSRCGDVIEKKHIPATKTKTGRTINIRFLQPSQRESYALGNDYIGSQGFAGSRD